MKYSNLVIAIPHSSGHPHEAIGASWGNDPDVVRESNRWTDWFTDELFNSEIADVDVCIGFNDDGSRPSDETLDAIEKVFADAGYRVARNHPYGNAIAPFGYVGHSVMIEVNKHCYMDEATLAKNQVYPKLAATIRECYLRLLGRNTLDEPIRTVRGHD